MPDGTGKDKPAKASTRLSGVVDGVVSRSFSISIVARCCQVPFRLILRSSSNGCRTWNSSTLHTHPPKQGGGRKRKTPDDHCSILTKWARDPFQRPLPGCGAIKSHRGQRDIARCVNPAQQQRRRPPVCILLEPCLEPQITAGESTKWGSGGAVIAGPSVV